jgi:hypothetical protein
LDFVELAQHKLAQRDGDLLLRNRDALLARVVDDDPGETALRADGLADAIQLGDAQLELRTSARGDAVLKRDAP